jgi:cell wall-associated NlpC family hydrolase
MNIEEVGKIIKTVSTSYTNKDILYITNDRGNPVLSLTKPGANDDFIGTIYQVDALSPDAVDVLSLGADYYINNRPIITLCRGTGLYDFSVPETFENTPPFTGRPFIHTKWDCFTLLSDFYKRELNITLPPVEYFDDWWKKGKDFYMQLSGVAGFYPVTELKKYDVIAMRINAYVFNHSAIYLGDNKILHHMGGKFSCIETIRPAYHNLFYGFFRHKELVSNG